MSDRVCPKCGGAMEEGVLATPQQSGLAILMFRLRWLPGPVKEGFWSSDTVKSSGEELAVVNFACRGCGYIESYLAGDEQK